MVEEAEMYRSFNMGVGLVLVVSPNNASKVLESTNAFIIGEVVINEGVSFRMRRIVFHQNGFGDLLVCFKALYAIKCLYPKDKLILAQKGFSDESFLQNISFH